MLAGNPVGAKGLDKYALLSVRRGNREEERRQFFRDVFIVPWGWDPRFYTLDGILQGKQIPEWRLCRYITLGWVRCDHLRPPGYGLTCVGEQVCRDELDEVTNGSGRDEDFDDDDWYDD